MLKKYKTELIGIAIIVAIAGAVHYFLNVRPDILGLAGSEPANGEPADETPKAGGRGYEGAQRTTTWIPTPTARNTSTISGSGGGFTGGRLTDSKVVSSTDLNRVMV